MDEVLGNRLGPPPSFIPSVGKVLWGGPPSLSDALIRPSFSSLQRTESHSKAALTLEPLVLWSGALSICPQALCLPPLCQEPSLHVATQPASDHFYKNDDRIKFSLREKQDINTSWYTININNISAIISIIVRFNKSDGKRAWGSHWGSAVGAHTAGWLLTKLCLCCWQWSRRAPCVAAALPWACLCVSLPIGPFR